MNQENSILVNDILKLTQNKHSVAVNYIPEKLLLVDIKDKLHSRIDLLATTAKDNLTSLYLTLKMYLTSEPSSIKYTVTFSPFNKEADYSLYYDVEADNENIAIQRAKAELMADGLDCRNYASSQAERIA